MKLYAQTLTDHLTKICRPTLMGQSENRELRIFLASQPPQIIYETAKLFREFLYDYPKQIDLVFKVGWALWDSWNQSHADYDETLLQTLVKEDWVDQEDKLTHFRNLKWSADSGDDYLIIVLVGVDLARDQASLQDFFRVDGETIWNDALRRSFQPWIHTVFERHTVYAEEEQMVEIDALLQVLHRYSAGDILRIADFLEQLDLSGAQDGNDALRCMYDSLGFWDLPRLQEMSFRNRRNWPKYVKDAISFFTYKDFLKESNRKKARKKIDRFEERLQEGNEDISFSAEFADTEDLLTCLRDYITKNLPAARDSLLQTDFAPIRDEILNYKDTGPKPPPRRSIIKIDGPPLETILKALWHVLLDFKKICTKNNVQPASVLQKISIEGLKFRHDLDDDSDGKDLIRGCLGGADLFLKNNLQLELIVNDEKINIPVTSRLLPDNLNDLRLERAGAGVSGFQFKIIFRAEDDFFQERTFQWQLPENQPYRNLWNLANEVCEKVPQAGPCLPVFHIPFYDEIFLASDTDEANRILKLGIAKLELKNLLDLEQLIRDDDLWPKLGDLSHAFGAFLESLRKDGYFHALEEPLRNFCEKYEETIKPLVFDSTIGPANQFAPLLYKAFAIIPEDEQNSHFSPFIKSMILTGLHPALLEMVRNRETFLVHGFIAKAQNILNDVSGLKMTLQHWESVCDLATIKYPLFGIIADASKNLDTQIKSHGLIHCLGSPSQTTAPLSAKILLRSDDSDEEEMTDSDLFRESRESRVIKRILEEYVQIYPHAEDGISLAVINADNFQTIIAGIDSFLREQFKKRNQQDNSQSPLYHFSLTLFNLASQQQEAFRHLQEWRKRWELSRETPKFAYYHRCRLSVAHRVAQDIDGYLKLAGRGDFEADLAMMVNFIAAGTIGNDVEPAEPFKVDMEHPLKFPIVEMPRCKDENPISTFLRAKVISNRRFRLATLLSELSARFKHPGYPVGQQYIVISQGDYSRWIKLIDKLHQRATWVLCLDPAMDERLAAKREAVGDIKREIIGFASGLGFRGELNYTLSTERSSLVDVEKGIAKQVNRLFGPWEKDVVTKTAHFLVTHSRKLSGLSLVRSTGQGEKHIRDLISYTLVRIILPRLTSQGICLCDVLISLDAFSHWFDDAGSQKRPDLMRLTAYLRKGGTIALEAQIVECKLAQENSAHLEKAHVQVENGLRHLVEVFMPRQGSERLRFDQRYWWAQLQRLVASKSDVPSNKQTATTSALELLGEGHFEICWQAMAVIFWTDSEADTFENIQQWDFFFKNRHIDIDVFACGKGLVKQLCIEKEKMVLPCSSNWMCFPERKKIPDGKKSLDSKKIVEEIEPEEKNVLAPQTKPRMSEESHIIAGRDEHPEHVRPFTPESGVTSKVGISFTPPLPDRIFLGRTIGGIRREIFWEFGHPQLTNRHFLIFGKSGVGKTYAIQSILYELSLKSQHSVIIDYTSGFLPNQLETVFVNSIHPKTHLVRQSPLPINPFRRQEQIIEGFEPIIEDAHTVGGRVTSVFTSVYSSMGEQQIALLIKTIAEGLETYGASYNFDILLENLEEQENKAINLANKISPLVRSRLFTAEDNDSWTMLYYNSEYCVNILQLAGVPREMSRMATEFILWDLYDFASNQGKKDRPLPLVLDEIQNLDHRLDAPLAKILTEGRKFGLSGILATQTLSNLPFEARDRLFQASHKLFFKPAETELKEYAIILSNSTREKLDVWKDRLINLNKGECYTLGPALNQKTGKLEEKAFPIKISSMEERKGTGS